MKRKLALLLTVTMLATSVYTPWLANAAEFTSGEENSLYTEEKPETEEIEEEPEADTEEAGEEEVQEDILSDENTDTGEAEEIQPSEEMTEGKKHRSFCQSRLTENRNLLLRMARQKKPAQVPQASGTDLTIRYPMGK